MTTTIQNQEIKQASDIKTLEELLQGIIGKTCWGARLGYGNELKLEIGSKISSPVIASKEIGLWRLGARASRWILELSSDIFVTSEDDLMSIRQNVNLINGSSIAAFNINWPKLKFEIMFHNQKKLQIIPVWIRGSKIAHWEFFMPNSMFLKVGPEAAWSYYRSDTW